MRRALLFGCVLSSACFDSTDWLSGGSSTLVCVEGDAGSCCELESDVVGVCTPEGCSEPDRGPHRCIQCYAWEFDEDAGGWFTRKDLPQPEPTAFGTASLYVEVCGAATYRRY